ncbi:MAG: response regulator [Pseudomonadota bacterium]
MSTLHKVSVESRIQGEDLRPEIRALHIWLVDDSPAELMLLERAVLGACPDAKLTRFTTVAGALERWCTVTPHVVFVDLNLPGESGLDLVQRIDAADDRAPVTIAVLTGVRPPKSLLEQLERSASHPRVMLKPVRSQHVRDVLAPLEVQR